MNSVLERGNVLKHVKIIKYQNRILIRFFGENDGILEVVLSFGVGDEI